MNQSILHLLCAIAVVVSRPSAEESKDEEKLMLLIFADDSNVEPPTLRNSGKTPYQNMPYRGHPVMPFVMNGLRFPYSPLHGFQFYRSPLPYVRDPSYMTSGQHMQPHNEYVRGSATEEKKQDQMQLNTQNQSQGSKRCENCDEMGIHEDNQDKNLLTQEFTKERNESENNMLEDDWKHIQEGEKEVDTNVEPITGDDENVLDTENTPEEDARQVPKIDVNADDRDDTVTNEFFDEEESFLV
ncbi:uncharacterized protein LOC136033228 [Artemia franciscana]|uniref:Uncharacterized protein n=1 Tax=Artemia franciscana TaxID=6661 RepID=A0AA88IF04_ARTSF|nr:hypothetical protein QYM36_008088 [Artemia franciscana]